MGGVSWRLGEAKLPQSSANAPCSSPRTGLWRGSELLWEARAQGLAPIGQPGFRVPPDCSRCQQASPGSGLFQAPARVQGYAGRLLSESKGLDEGKASSKKSRWRGASLSECRHTQPMLVNILCMFLYIM